MITSYFLLFRPVCCCSSVSHRANLFTMRQPRYNNSRASRSSLGNSQNRSRISYFSVNVRYNTCDKIHTLTFSTMGREQTPRDVSKSHHFFVRVCPPLLWRQPTRNFIPEGVILRVTRYLVRAKAGVLEGLTWSCSTFF